MQSGTDPKEPPNPKLGNDKGAAPRVRVDQLLGGRKEAILEHEGQDYRLRITSAGKLILTK